MKKRMDEHRKVKIDYSVLRELLSYITQNDGYANYNGWIDGWSTQPFPKNIKEKARNILDNS